MIEYSDFQRTNRIYNFNQPEGECLKTLRGYSIKRSHFGVGKVVSSKLYFHKIYADEILPEDSLVWYHENESKVPFEFNCLRYHIDTSQILFVECPNFDTEREPIIGRTCKIDRRGIVKVRSSLPHIYHHKWTFVKEDYDKFDVAESWRWSREWLSTLTEPAIGTSLNSWQAQLSRFGLA